MIEETVVDQEFIDRMNKMVSDAKQGGLIESCSKSVCLFAEYMLGIKLRAWQIMVLQAMNDAIDGKISIKEFLDITSRQIGKTTKLGVFDLWACTFNKRPGGIYNSTQIANISISDDQAKKVLRENKKLIKLGDRKMASYVDEKGNALFTKNFFTSLIDETEPNNTSTITFKSYNKGVHGDYLLKDSMQGSFIKSLPPTPIILGNTYSIIHIDEAGKSEKMTDVVFYDYILPTGDEMDALITYSSTPWVLSGFFYRKVNPNDDYDEDEGVMKFLFTLDAIKIEAPERYARVKKKCDKLILDGKKDEVDRAYYCKFVKGQASYFDPDKVFKVFSEDYESVEGFKGECDMGIDFGGQTVSRTVVTISACHPETGIIRRLYHRVYEVGQDITLLEDVEELYTRFNIQRNIPDDCPAGWHIIERMKQKGWNVIPMNFKSDKVKKYSSFRAAMNRDVIRSYKDDVLKTEMLSLQQSQGIRSTQIEHAPGYTDDLIDSFLMSCYFFTDNDEEFNFYSLDYEDEHSDR